MCQVAFTSLMIAFDQFQIDLIPVTAYPLFYVYDRDENDVSRPYLDSKWSNGVSAVNGWLLVLLRVRESC